jgi:hypothetical protein
VCSCKLPAEFGNLAALETVSLVGCEVASLPTTITRLTRCTAAERRCHMDVASCSCAVV